MRARHVLLAGLLPVLLGTLASCATHDSSPPFASTTSLRLILYG